MNNTEYFEKELNWINESIENLSELCSQYNIKTKEDINNVLKLVQMYNDLKKIGAIE